jgi:hypothetical protein
MLGAMSRCSVGVMVMVVVVVVCSVVQLSQVNIYLFILLCSGFAHLD